ncbi:MAG: efflux RND transporter periplasmic adaptor subunit [Chitinophagaceae bacterium]|nr:MAG: efflux RND transporter periplasmic adaptor subunit [Chitinophagaceae bacterium]
MNNKTIKWIALGVFLLLIFGGLIYQTMSGSAENVVEEPPGRPAQQSMAVNMFVTDYSELENFIDVSGTTLPDESVVLSAEISGLLTSIYVREGSRVEKGQLIAKVNDAELQAELARANTNLRLSETNLERQKRLLAREGISQQEFDNAEAQYQVNLSEVNLIKARIEKTEVRAPFSGITGLRKVSPGQYVTPGMEIISLIKPDPIKIDFPVPQIFANQIKEGTKFRFQTSGSAEFHEGTIYATESVIQANSRALMVRGRFNNEDMLITPGSFINAKVLMEQSDSAILIPTVAVVPILNGQQVYLFKNGKVKPQEVETGTRMANKIQITGGISAGDTVITSGLLQIRPEMEVRAAEISSTSN